MAGKNSTKKDVLMIVHTMGTMLASDNDRFSYIAKLLLDKDCNVEMVTSDFEHHKKNYRNLSIATEHPFKITFLHENKYKKNISISRIIGHVSFAKNLRKYLNSRKVPDVIYCAIPPTVSANVAAKFASKNKIPFVIDVQDLWPESFEIALGHNPLAKAILKPMSYFANGAYKRANAIIAVSNTYVKRASKNNKIAKYKESVYLGTDGKKISCLNTNELENSKDERVFRIGYVGNIGKSYDFLHLFQALNILKKKGIDDIELYILGDGDYRKQVESYILEYYEKVTITGYLPYLEMMTQLETCDISINPIIMGTFSSVVNKVGDYAAAGLAVINTQDNQEYRKIVEENNIGINAKTEDSEDMANCIYKLYSDRNLCKVMGDNNKMLFNERFDRSKTYKRIIDCILEDYYL